MYLLDATYYKSWKFKKLKQKKEPSEDDSNLPEQAGKKYSRLISLSDYA